MARDRSGSEYSESMSEATSCSCTTTSSVDKARSCSPLSRGCCGMFQEPFFLHPPGSRPRDGIYVNPMSAYIGEPAKPKDTAESFYLHSPQDLVYTRITRLFADTVDQRHAEKRDDGLTTVKVDVHVNNNGLFVDRPSNGTELPREPSEHAYEQICLRQDSESTGGTAVVHRKATDGAPDRTSDRSSRARKTERRCSRSSSASDCSNVSSEIPCFSSSVSTPSLSRNSSNERIGKSGKVLSDSSHEKKEAGATGAGATGVGGSQVESEKGIKPANGGASFAKPPPPPPPPPPPDKEDTALAVHAVNGKQSATDKDEKVEPGQSEGSRSDRNENGGPPSIATATNKTEVSGGEHRQQPEVPAASPAADPEEIKASQASHLVNKHMVLPFIPPQFANADSNTLLKPSEYLRSICKGSAKSSLSKARSVDNLDIQSRGLDRREEEEEEEPSGEAEVTEAETGSATKKESFAGPPPPPLCPLQKARRNDEDSVGVSTSTESESSRTPQPLATISIQDLTSIQLRRTTAKMNATKTFSAPPPRSVSMTNVAESFFVQKTDLIAELKRTKDIPGIKKLKVEMAQVEKTQEQNLMSEINKAFNVSKFVDQIPEKDSSGNVIPIWKRQMLARKAAERAKKELEEQIARENEERRQKAIPAWKRQLLAKKDNEEKRLIQAQPVSTVKVETAQRPEEKPDAEEKKSETSTSPSTSPSTGTQGNHRTQETNDDAPIIPWRAQLRKTNSKLNILE